MRRLIEALVDDLILFLDEIDGDVDLEPASDDDIDVADEPHDPEPLEHTANETHGCGFFNNLGPREDDAEDGADQEHRSTDQDEWESEEWQAAVAEKVLS